MRLIKTFDTESLAGRCSLFLKKMRIENRIEIASEENLKNKSYYLWIENEDKVEKARKYLEDFEKDPLNNKFDVSLAKIYPQNEDDGDVVGMEESDKKQEVNPPLDKKKSFSLNKTELITSFILIICIFVYLLNLFQESDIKKRNPKLSYVILTPVQKALLFDVPYILIELDKVIKNFDFDPSKDLNDQPKEVKEEIAKIENKPYWQGFYNILISEKGFSDQFKKVKGTLFESLRKKELWRLFSPCLLHRDFLHLLFNMLWLWLLGRQMEGRLSKFKYIFFILIVGIVSNIFQYFMSGPNFMGYSGVITGMVGFIYARQKIAPWEGYPLQKSVYLFLGVYVAVMFLLSFVSFFSDFLGMDLFSTNIANTAHIAGAVIGYLLGRMTFFSRRVLHER